MGFINKILLPMDRNIMDAASGGALVDKTPTNAINLIENMSINSLQFTTRRNSAVVLAKGVNEIQSTSNKNLKNRLDELTALVKKKKMTAGQTQTTRVCGICTSPEHPTDACPTLQESDTVDTPQAYAANIYNDRSNPNYYLSSNKYNPNWKYHPSLRWGNTSGHQQPRQQPALQQNNAATTPNPSLDDIVKQMAVNNLQFQQTTTASIKDLLAQVGQLATSMNQMQTQSSGNLPAQTVQHPNISSITLRSGK
jgi:hypothetical protein